MRESANITLADIDRLIEENERMKAEVERLEAALVHNSEWRDENIRVWALVDRLKAALREIEPLTQTCYEAADIARAALEGK